MVRKYILGCFILVVLWMASPSIALADKFSRNVVVEEGTATWCGWCVRGIYGIDRMKTAHPNDFIPICVHEDDALEAPLGYGLLETFFTSIPKCVVDRNTAYILDPTSDNLSNAYSLERNNATARVECEGYRDPSTGEVEMYAWTEFGYDDAEADVALAFVVLEDNVGPFNQRNYYAGGGNGTMGGYENKASYVSMKFNDVARAIYSFTGIAGTLPSTIVKNELYYTSHLVPLPANVDDKANVKYVVLIIDRTSGQILNAARATVMDKAEIS